MSSREVSRARGSRAARSRNRAGGRRQPPSASTALGSSGSLLFAEDVAAMVGMAKDWVYAETRAGRIPHVALGRYYRYRPESIDAWLREMERGSVEVPQKASRLRPHARGPTPKGPLDATQG